MIIHTTFHQDQEQEPWGGCEEDEEEDIDDNDDNDDDNGNDMDENDGDNDDNDDEEKEENADIDTDDDEDDVLIYNDDRVACRVWPYRGLLHLFKWSLVPNQSISWKNKSHAKGRHYLTAR